MSTPEEKDRIEHKSEYEHDAKGKAMLVTTIVAMANTRGGSLHLQSIACKFADLDGARLDDLINKYVAPRIGGIASVQNADASVVITVEDSEDKPHVFTEELKYRDERGRDKLASHRGQVVVRHSSKAEPADGDDIARIVRFRIGQFLRQLSVSVDTQNVPVRLTDDEGLPVHLVPAPEGSPAAVAAGATQTVNYRASEDPAAPALRVDVEDRYPHTTSHLANKVGRHRGWVAQAAKVLKMKGDAKYHREVSTGRSTIPRYSEDALARLQDHCKQDQGWNPWKAAEAQ